MAGPMSLACPRCSRELVSEADIGLRCEACSKRYPYLDGVACLTPDPEMWRAKWRGRLDGYAEVLGDRVEGLRAEAAQRGLLPRTRARVWRVAEALVHERKVIRDFAELLGEPSPAEKPSSNLPIQLLEADKQAVIECDEHVFRDWVWGQEEVDRLRAFAERMVPERIDTLAVYGVGAGRLAVDVHRSLRPSRTFALDWSPLALWAAARLLRGEALERFELPLWPNRDEDVVVKRKISYSEPVPPGFSFLIADALEPPFAPGSLDAVLTCWFIDVVPTDLRQLAPRINRVLRPGGLWINAGPLRFKGASFRSYSIEEVHEIVELSGFDLLAREREDLPYFASPLGGTRALETAFGFSARKKSDADAFQAESTVPPWLLDMSLPVQATPAIVRLQKASIVAAGIISLVDGVRSISEIAEVLASTWQVDAAQVVPQLRSFFSLDEA